MTLDLPTTIDGAARISEGSKWSKGFAVVIEGASCDTSGAVRSKNVSNLS